MGLPLLSFLRFSARVCGQDSDVGGKPSSMIPWGHWEYVAASFVAMLQVFAAQVFTGRCATGITDYKNNLK
jgi:hypothetical protein